MVWFFLIIFLAFPVQASDRCAMLVQDVRVEHIKQFGFAFPYWYSVAQLKQESACRTSVTAFDQGQGVAQFMPKTAQYICSLMGETLDPYNPKHAIRMQAFYMARIHNKENFSANQALWIDYRIYNGGAGALKAEYLRAGVLDPDVMHLFCERRKIQFKWGILDLCVVNKEYAEKVYKYGDAYRRGPDGMRFW